MLKKLLLAGFVLGAVFVVSATPNVASAQTVPLSGYAWSSLPDGNNPDDDGAGWIKFSGPNYGVVANTFSGNLSGQAWSENFGWLSFDSADIAGCPSAPCQPNVNPSTGAVTGWARFIAAPTGTTDTWNGWVHLSDGSTYAVTYNSGTQEFSGNAWGENYIGWIKWKGTGYVVTMPPLTPPEATINVVVSPSNATWDIRLTDPPFTLIKSGVGNGTATVTPAVGGTSYTIVPGGAPSGYDYPPSVTNSQTSGSAATLTPNTSVTFTVTYNQSFNYSLSNSGDVTVEKAGIPKSPPDPQQTVTATRLSGSGQIITLTSSGQPSGVSITYSPLSGCTPTAGTPCVFTSTIFVQPTAAVGDYTITVTATPQGNGPVKITSFNLRIDPAPNLISSCSHTGGPNVGDNVTWTVAITNNPNPQPPYSYYWTGSNLPNTIDYPPTGHPTSTSFMISYSTTGSKNATAVVTDNNNNQATCPTDTINIGVNPGFGEF